MSGPTVKPSRMQYIFARDWPKKAYFILAALLGIWAAINHCQPSWVVFSDWQYALLFIFSIVVAPVFTYYVSLTCAWLVLGPMYRLRAKLNGAPFLAGDRVRILAGPHRDCVVPIYAVRGERGQVCVELPVRAKSEENDVFFFTQICRESACKPK